MSYENWFDPESSRSDSHKNFTYYIHVQDPTTLLPKEVAYRDDVAARDIESARQLIADLTEYRKALAARYAQLATMPYTLRLELIRENRYYQNNKKWYWLRIVRRYEDGTEAKELEERYPGPQRHKAFARFRSLQKERPGIEIHQDTDKRPWEH
ncbi:hypothetical protein AAEU42_01020 [Pseudoflavonifractor phocaeensis]|uniref:hypothetical protein n=1 Tax=Pseudoflavonifractor phocaeensis TaxID=1870988 RepID=UPI00313DE190